MSDCSVSAKIAGVIFTKGYKRKLFWHSKRGSISTQVRVNIKGTGFDPLTMAHVIQGAMLMSLPTARKWLISKNC
jgi:hypothetical protein